MCPKYGWSRTGKSVNKRRCNFSSWIFDSKGGSPVREEGRLEEAHAGQVSRASGTGRPIGTFGISSVCRFRKV
jgi:hypothetical protein